MAAGVLFAALAQIIAGAVVLVVAAVRLLVAGGGQLVVGGIPSVLLALGFAVGGAAALVFVMRDRVAPRAWTVLLAFVVSMSWPLSGIPLVAALLSVLAVGVALGRDHRSPGGRRVSGLAPAAVLAVAAMSLAVAGAAAAESRPTPRYVPDAAASGDAVPPPRAAAKTKGPDRARKGGRRAPRAAAKTKGPDRAPRGGGRARSDAAKADDAGPAPGASTLPEASPALDDGATTPSASTAGAATFVRAYYRALDDKRYLDAWRSLTPAVQKQFGGFASWKAGYGRTISSRPRDLKVTAGPAGVTVKHVLVARDKGCAGAREFEITWRLRPAATGWSAAGLSGATRGSTAECR